MFRCVVIVLLSLAGLLSLFFGNLFSIFGILIFAWLLVLETAQYTEAAYVQIAGALTMEKRLRAYGKWGVITGCTRGIGLEFSRQLAAIGMDLILVARNPRLLETITAEITSTYNVRVITIVADFARNDREMYEEVKAKLAAVDGEIGILVNNVGVFYESPLYFHEVEEKDILDTVNVNVTPALLLSHYLIKHRMMPRKKGLVVFIGSASSLRTNPLFNAYAASKAFIDNLARALHEEYKHTGVYVQAILPFYVATDMASYSSPEPSLLAPDARTYVRWSLATFGMTSLTSAYFPHTVQRFIMMGIPDWFYLWAYRPKVEKFRLQHQTKKTK